MFVEDTLSPEEIAAAKKAWKKLREKNAAEKAAKQFSIVDPPLRDRATSRPAKAKESTIAAAPALGAEIRRRLDALLKKND